MTWAIPTGLLLHIHQSEPQVFVLIAFVAQGFGAVCSLHPQAQTRE